MNIVGQDKKFTLLYKASKDGFLAHNFHTRCDNQGPTLCLLKVPDKRDKGFLGVKKKVSEGAIIGGYTSIPWLSEGGIKKGNGDSFVFKYMPDRSFRRFDLRPG